MQLLSYMDNSKKYSDSSLKFDKYTLVFLKLHFIKCKKTLLICTFYCMILLIKKTYKLPNFSSVTFRSSLSSSCSLGYADVSKIYCANRPHPNISMIFFYPDNQALLINKCCEIFLKEIIKGLQTCLRASLLRIPLGGSSSAISQSGDCEEY